MKQKVLKEDNAVLVVFKKEEMRNVSQQLGWFMVRVLWLSNKTSQVKYDINTFTTHIERTKKFLPDWVRTFFFTH